MFIPSITFPSPLTNSPVFNTTTEESSLPENLSPISAETQIFNYLKNQEIIDTSGCLKLNLAIPRLQKAQLDRINEILNCPFIIKSKDDSFEITITLKELFAELKIDSIDIVGGTVFWILGSDYIQQVCDILKIPAHLITEDFLNRFKNKASDIDIRVSTFYDMNYFKEPLCSFLAKKLPEKFNGLDKNQVIESQAFTKYGTPKPDETSDRFFIAAFGNRKDFSIDLLFVNYLKRKHIFYDDGVKIQISGLNQAKPCYFLKSQSGSILESIILKLTKVLNTEAADEIDAEGSAMLFSHITKGYRCISEDLKNTLTSNFLQSYKFTHLTKIIKNHFVNQPFAPFLLCFNVCSLLPGNKDLILNIVKELLPLSIDQSATPLLQYIKQAMMLLNAEGIKKEEAKQIFEAITALFQVFGSLLLLFGNQNKEIEVLRTKTEKETFLQFKFILDEHPLYITVKDDLNSGLHHLKNNSSESIFHIFHLLSDSSIIPPEKAFSDLSKETDKNLDFQNLNIAFDLLEESNNSLNQIGFYLLCHKGICEKNSRYLTHLLLKLPFLLEKEKSPTIKKNLVYSLFKYWMTTDSAKFLLKISDKAEAFYKSCADHNNPLQAFSLTFCEIEMQSIAGLILSLIKIESVSFDEETNQKLIKGFMRHHPYVAMSILKELSIKRKDSKNDLNLLLAILDYLPKHEQLRFKTQWHKQFSEIRNGLSSKETIQFYLKILETLDAEDAKKLISSDSSLIQTAEDVSISLITAKDYLLAFKIINTFDLTNLNIINALKACLRQVKLKVIAKSVKKKEIDDFLQLFSLTLPLFKDSKEATDALQSDVIDLLIDIQSKATPQQMIAFFTVLSDYEAIEFLHFKIHLASAIVESCNTEKPKQLKSPHLQFAPLLKKLVDVCFEKDLIDDLSKLISLKFYSTNDYFFYLGKLSQAIFEDLKDNQSVERIENALKIYTQNLESPDECLEFQTDNLKNAVEFLTDLIFIQADSKAYLTQYSNLTNKLLKFADPKYNYIELHYLLHPDQMKAKPKNTKPTKVSKETLLMREKIYELFFHLTDSFSTKLLKYKYQINPLTSGFSSINTCHISYLIPFIEKKEQVIAAMLRYSAISLFLPCGLSTKFREFMQILVKYMDENNYFKASDSMEECKTNYKLHLINYTPEFIPTLNKKVSGEYLKITKKDKAFIILDLIRKIRDFKGALATYTAMNFLTDHAQILYEQIPDEVRGLSVELFNSKTSV